MDTATMQSTTVLSRSAGGLGLAHVALLIGGLALSGGGALLEDGSAGIEAAYVNGSLTTILGGWFVESVGFVLLVPVAVYLGRVLGRSSPVGTWAARSGTVLAGVYVAITLAVGFPAGAAAAYGVQHGLDVDGCLGTELDARLRVPVEPALPGCVCRLHRRLGSRRRLLTSVRRRSGAGHRRIASRGWSPGRLRAAGHPDAALPGVVGGPVRHPAAWASRSPGVSSRSPARRQRIYGRIER